MKPQIPSHSHGELARPITSPAAVFGAETQQFAPAVPLHRSGLAKPAAANTLTATSILRALHRRQLAALGAAILLTGICGPAAYFLVPHAKFKAQARLQLKAQAPKILFQTVDTDSAALDDYRRYQTTQMALVKSQLALSAALRDGEVGKCPLIRNEVDPIGWLVENLKVEFIQASELMEISLSGDDPQQLAIIVNAVKKAYIEEVVNVDLKMRTARFDQLTKLKQKYTEMLAERRETLRKLAQTIGSDDKQTIAYGQQIAMEHQQHVRNELLAIQSQKRRLQAQLKVRSQRPEESSEEIPAQSISDAEIDEWIEHEPSIANLAAKRAHQEEALNTAIARARASSRRPAADPSLRHLRQDMAATEKLLNSKRAELRPTAIRELKQKEVTVAVARNGGVAAEQELLILDDIEQQLKSQLKSVSEGNQTLTKHTLDLQSIQDDVAQMQQSALRVGAEVEALNVELGAPPRIRTIEDAVPPLTVDDKKRKIMLAVIIFGSFFTGLFGIAFIELQNQKVDSADEVPTHLGLQVVGTLPILRAKTGGGRALARRHAEKERYWSNLMVESIDATRTMLIHAAGTRLHRVVMITSAVSGEGKTALSSHLATSLARGGLRTLLIDGDLRCPSIHRLFNLPVGPGLSEVIRGDVEWADVIAAPPIEDLHILTAGTCDRPTLGLLSQGCLISLFAQLKEKFDFVIVDSSPILPVADGLIIAQHVDAVLFSIFRDRSRKTKVAAASERLQCLGVPILGAVVTGAHGGRYGNDYNSDGTYRPMPDAPAGSSEQSRSS
ncbi:MAG: polysaccharide biosynthesis tyrosine autokinase [Isosphaeraceae bacterium]